MCEHRWSAIAAKLGGRTDNDIKNYWMTHLQKREKSNKSAEEENSSQASNRKKIEKASPRSDDATSVHPKSCSSNSKVSSQMFILESSNSNSSSLFNAFKWDLNLSVEQNGLDQTL